MHRFVPLLQEAQAEGVPHETTLVQRKSESRNDLWGDTASKLAAVHGEEETLDSQPLKETPTMPP